MHDITSDKQDLQTLRIKELRRLLGDWNNDDLLAVSEFAAVTAEHAQLRKNAKRLAADVRTLITAALDRLKPPGELDQTALHLNDTRWHDALWLPYLVIYGPFFHPMVRTFNIQRLCEQFALSRTHLYRRQNEALVQLLAALDVLASRFTASTQSSPGRHIQSAAPTCFFGRETELERLCSMLQSNVETGCRWIGVYGEPGIGKSAFMAALAQQDALRSHYRITAIQVGPDRQPDAVLVDVALALGIGRSIAVADSAAAQIERISAEIADKPTLLLIDDLWNLQQLDLLRQVPAAAVVFSTRQPRLANAELVQQSYRLKGLSESAALDVIQHFSGQLPPDLREISRSLVNTYDCLPLWLQLIGRHMRRVGYDGQHTRVSETLKRLIANARLRLDLGSEAQALSSLRACIDLSVGALDAQTRQALHDIATLAPKPNSFSREAFLAITRCDVECLYDLVDVGLISGAQGRDRYALHASIRDYLTITDTGADRGERLQRLVEYYCTVAPHLGAHDMSFEAENLTTAFEMALGTGATDRATSIALVIAGWQSSVGHMTEAERVLGRLTGHTAYAPTADADVLLAEIYRHTGRIAECEAICIRLLQNESGARPSCRAKAHELMAHIAHLRGDTQSTALHLRSALACCSDEQTLSLVPRIMAMEYQLGVKALEPVADPFAMFEHLPATFDAWLSGVTNAYTCNVAAANEILVEAMANQELRDDPGALFTTGALYSATLLWAGEFDACRALAKTAWQQRAHSVFPQSAGMCGMVIAEAATARGEFEQAIQESLGAYETLMQENNPHGAGWALLAACHAGLFLNDRLEDTYSWSMDCVRLTSEQSDIASWALTFAGLACLRQGNHGDAERLIRQAKIVADNQPISSAMQSAELLADILTVCVLFGHTDFISLEQCDELAGLAENGADTFLHTVHFARAMLLAASDPDALRAAQTAADGFARTGHWLQGRARARLSELQK